MKLEQLDVPVLLKRKKNTWKFISCDNIGMSILLEGLLETALKEHQHFLRIILKWRTPHLARYYHFTALSATKNIVFYRRPTSDYEFFKNGCFYQKKAWSYTSKLHLDCISPAQPEYD